MDAKTKILTHFLTSSISGSYRQWYKYSRKTESATVEN